MKNNKNEQRLAYIEHHSERDRIINNLSKISES